MFLKKSKAIKYKLNFIDPAGEFHFILPPIFSLSSLSVLTPFPGTKLFDMYKNQDRLIYTNFSEDWIKFDGSETIYKLKNIEYQEFWDTCRKCINIVYSRLNLINKFYNTLVFTKNIETAIWAYNINFNFRNIALSITKK
jgi:radical SAM superfamily enzyme YgiQ (UPF0313 family)